MVLATGGFPYQSKNEKGLSEERPLVESVGLQFVREELFQSLG